MATAGDFVDQPRSRTSSRICFEMSFGIEKTSVRPVIGVASLPLGVPIGLDVIFKVAE
jgi:hypothetical protein